jgi:superfamily II DNA or RNA helicase
MSIVLHGFGSALEVIAAEKALQVVCRRGDIDWASRETWPVEINRSALGKRLSWEVPMALEMGLATADATVAEIPYGNFQELDKQEMCFHRSFSAASPFLLQIGRTGVLGRADFQYQLKFLLGHQPVPLRITGPFLARDSTDEKYHLDATQYALVSALQQFNALPGDERTPQTSWLAFADVKRLSAEVGALLDAWLQANDVVVPPSIGLDFYEEADGALSFVPTSPGLDNEDFRTVFQRSQDAHELYTIQRSGGARVRVVLTDRQKEVLQRMKRVQRVTGRQRETLLKDPLIPFDGVAGDVNLPDSYGGRVIGIGTFHYNPAPKAPSDGSELSALWAGAATGMKGDEHIRDPKDKAAEKTLLIETDEHTVPEQFALQAARASGHDEHWSFVPPAELADQCRLDEYQKHGIGWLQRCSQIRDRRGVLLADDMGLGKTLQLLTFIAWAIETNCFPELSRPRPPYRPILIVAPLILLENQTWEGEMKRFFREKGSVFSPILPLYGPSLRSLRRKDLAGREGTLATPILDLDRIRQHRVVITNYEAVRDYEFSFAYHPEGTSLWSMVISDEAHEYKTPSSRISHAMKKLDPPFRIACTGTPVENRLLDLWNIMDSLQPGLLDTAEAFVKHYESDTTEEKIGTLKRKLQYGANQAFMLRRSKDEVLNLPEKHIKHLHCAMSEAEIREHQTLAQGIQTDSKKGKGNPLESFARLYQHPALLRSSGDELSSAELCADSSKLRAVVELLRSIQKKGEKVLIFARHKDAQRMLASVLSDEFGFSVRILNGDTPSSASSRNGGALTRRLLLSEFRSRPGFHIIILSPFVAGVGLTITEANHVIHYGRWWNPAIEAQATDRAHRRGQTKPVHVYLPLLHDPTGRVPDSFDQIVDRLMNRKEQLARTTLAKEGFQAAADTDSDANDGLIRSLAGRVSC